MNKLFLVFSSLLLAAQGMPLTLPQVPDELAAPTGEKIVLLAHAKGAQVYVCKEEAGQKFAWTLKGPEAELFDAQGKKIGVHFAGPTWKHLDGSEVMGKVVAKHDAPKSDAIAWLLLTAITHGPDAGILSHVTSIQRIHTEAGLPPAAETCTAGSKDAESRSAYSADYYFYSAK